MLMIRSYSGLVILKVTYGDQPESQDVHFLLLPERVMAAFSQASQPGIWLADVIPWRASFSRKPNYFYQNRHMPNRLPGASFKHIAARWRNLHMEVIEGPYDWAKGHQVSCCSDIVHVILF